MFAWQLTFNSSLVYFMLFIYLIRCLTAAGEESLGTVDFHQMHCYAHNGGGYNENAPLEISNSVYGLDKPNIIGEFSMDFGDGRDITTMIDHAYYNGYRYSLSY